MVKRPIVVGENIRVCIVFHIARIPLLAKGKQWLQNPPVSAGQGGRLCIQFAPHKEECWMRNTILGIIFGLFAACFLAIIIEETFLGGRRRRRMERQLKEAQHENITGS
jgi:hypothetical protein